ncbi:restriction endonuclease subunit S [Marinicella sp. S1101]|uniref:restriction endonuclease subunit S n=1 Tax=Marinicella marina TaxID=2996016 RepID=UPI0022609352|nr:restriction endonuclease subunit S [Marinicella marina]MCX7553721.1 restriction endonuclease subunit S [Marinicella marina]
MRGNLPRQWKRLKVFDVAPIKSKLVDPKETQYAELTLIAPNHIESGSGRILLTETASAQGAISGKYLVKKGDVIYSKIRPYLQKSAVAEEECLCSADMYPLSCNSEVYPEYLNMILLGARFTYYANSCSARTGIPKLNREDMSAFSIEYPPLYEQKAIADLLATWDEAIEKTERLIQAKEANLKGQIQKLISQRCDFWPHVKPKRIFDTITEKNFPNEELLSVTQHLGVIPRNMLEGRVMSPDGTTANYKLISRGDFVISLRSFQGGIEYSNYKGIISPAYTVLRPKIKLNSDYYRLFFKSYIFIKKYLNLAVIGIRDGKQVSISDFLCIKIPVPPLEEQKKIAGVLSIYQQEIDLLRQLVEKFKIQKRGMMQKLLTGEWRVKPEDLKTIGE